MRLIYDYLTSTMHMVTFILLVAHHYQLFCAMQTTLKDIIITRTKFGKTEN